MEGRLPLPPPCRGNGWILKVLSRNTNLPLVIPAFQLKYIQECISLLICFSPNISLYRKCFPLSSDCNFYYFYFQLYSYVMFAQMFHMQLSTVFAKYMYWYNAELYFNSERNSFRTCCKHVMYWLWTQYTQVCGFAHSLTLWFLPSG
jgi:hypothetical protein